MKSSPEQVVPTENKAENLTTPEDFSVDAIERTHKNAEKKIEKITEGNPELRTKFQTMLKGPRAAALALAFLASVGDADAQETPKEKLDGGPILEQTVQPPTEIEKLGELSEEQAGAITGIISEELGRFLDGKKESASTLTDPKKDIEQKLDAGLNLVKTIPRITSKVPIIGVIEELRLLQQKLKNGASVKDIAVDFLGAAISTKTWGASDLLRNYLQAYEENRKAKGLPDITYNPDTQVGP